MACVRHKACYVSDVVRLIKHQFHLRGQAFLASVLAGLVLLLNALAASPSLHELLHHDASQADHHCAVTLFAHGTVDASPVDVPISVTLTCLETVAVPVVSAFSPAIENLPAGRAPPALSAVS
jgi:hypothetical protein